MINLRDFFNKLNEEKIEYEDSPLLKNHSSFETGGNAKALILPKSEDEIIRCIEIIKEFELSFMVIGKGSNLLFSDAGYDGVIIKLGHNFSKIYFTDEGYIYAQSGASLTALCKFALKHSLTGLEFAYGIPGSVGGAVYMNAGAYGGEMKDVLAGSCHICPDTGVGQCVGKDMNLSYRNSIYSDNNKIITGAILFLQKGNKEEIKAKMEDYLNRRKEKQPLDYPSFGSAFKRPVGGFASALIDECGLKGMSVGKAEVSRKHAGFIINKGNAKSSDAVELIKKVQKEVKEKTGFDLKCEVKILDKMGRIYWT